MESGEAVSQLREKLVKQKEGVMHVICMRVYWKAVFTFWEHMWENFTGLIRPTRQIWTFQAFFPLWKTYSFSYSFFSSQRLHLIISLPIRGT